jgi:hypothetical protein
MQCFIPFSEELLERYPDLMQCGLVPYSEDFLEYSVSVLPVEDTNMVDAGGSSKAKRQVL